MTILGPAEPSVRVLYDESRPDLRAPERPRPIRVYFWDPAHPAALPVPLVVVSHGTGGSGSDMDWLVHPLATAGFRVAALDHHGNNFIDGYEPEGFLFGWERPRDVSFVLDTLGRERPVGVAGFSYGGYTAAALVGARIDSQRVAAILSGITPIPEIPEFPGVLNALREKLPPAELQTAMGNAGRDLSDSRVRAAFAVAPGWGPFLTPESLALIQVPIEIRWGGADTIAPFHDLEPYLKHIPTAHGRSAGPHVRHEDFFAPDPADTTARDRVSQDAAAFFLQHIT